MFNTDFSNESFSSPDEIDDAMSDLVIMKVGQLASAVKSAPKKLNEQVGEYLKFVYKTLKFIVGDNGVVTYKMHDDLTGTAGSVSAVLSGGVVSFDNTEWLQNMMRVATTFEVYPKLDGSLVVDFGFNGLWDIDLDGDEKC